MASPVFIDTNVLVYAHLARSPLFAAASQQLRRLEDEGADLWISRQTLREYLSAMTRSGALSTTIPIAALVEDVRSMSEQFLVAEDGPQVTERLLTLLEQVEVGGKQIHDANIVATMLAQGIPRLLTYNVGDFHRFERWVEVLSLTNEIG
jgi:predicted nucleic acid-binding protein